MATLLMYHAVPATRGATGEWDAHYAVARPDFRAQLQQLVAEGRRPGAVGGLAAGELPKDFVGITFDDGTVTDATEAAQVLLDLGLRADFFVNPGTVGSRGFVSWPQLRELASAGFSVQSHAWSHRLLDDLTDTQIRQELDSSRREIEDRVGVAVTVFAPPGGRLPRYAVQCAREVGYLRICGSRPGLWTDPGAYVLPRMAVLASTTADAISAWCSGRRRAVLRHEARHAAMWMAKKALGNQRYRRLRARLLGPGAME
ncbi:MAG: hypothetical protein RL026_1569 [Pseudomonadota bacterium]|jgi:peptidoglycan/xylan/chitin deacetylase (PgdA/CDA1 family)